MCRRLCYEILACRLDSPDSLRPSEMRILFQSIAEGVNALHGKMIRVCHMDIKPGNLVFHKQGGMALKFIDFGSCSTRALLPSADAFGVKRHAQKVNELGKVRDEVWSSG